MCHLMIPPDANDAVFLPFETHYSGSVSTRLHKSEGLREASAAAAAAAAASVSNLKTHPVHCHCCKHYGAPKQQNN